MKLAVLLLTVYLYHTSEGMSIAGKEQLLPRQVAAAAAAGLGSALLAPIQNGLVQLEGQLMQYLSDNLLGDHPFQTILGRGVRIHASGTTVTIKDVATGVIVVGTGPTLQVITPESDVIRDHRQPDHFCNITSTYDNLTDSCVWSGDSCVWSVPCGDNFPKSYCEDQKRNGFCSPRSAFFAFMNDNCYGTCKGGC